MISEYTRYREFQYSFSSEIGGINIRRYGSFGDRIDHTLLDLKIYLEAEMKIKKMNVYYYRLTRNPNIKVAKLY